MSPEERHFIREKLKERCDDYNHCSECPLISINNKYCYNTRCSDDELESNYETMFARPYPEDFKEKPILENKPDVVSHPPHYNREGAMESFDEMLLVFGEEVVAHFCLCNAWKYRYRAMDKNGEEDIRKSDWYMNKYRELMDDLN